MQMDPESDIGGHDERSPLLESASRQAQQAVSKRFYSWVIFVLLALIIAIEFPIILQDTPRTRLYEIIYCREYYTEHDPNLVGGDGLIDEQLCKVGPVQSKVALLKGWMTFFDYAPGVLLAVPYGMLADKYGRKWLVIMNVVSTLFRSAWIYIVCAFSPVIPIRLVWLEAVAGLFGGGYLVALALVLVIVSDVTPTSQRVTTFFRVTAAMLACSFLAPPASAILMQRDPWIPMSLGLGLQALTIPIAMALPETLGTVKYEEEESPPKRVRQDSVDNDAAPIDALPSINLTKAGLLGSFKSIASSITGLSFLFKDRRILFLMLIYPALTATNSTDTLLLQYVSRRFSWTFAQATYLHSLMSGISIILLLILLPALSSYLQGKRNYSASAKDILLARLSLTVMALGIFIEGLAPQVSILLIGLVIATLGTGASAMLRSFMTSLVHPNEVARLYTAISIVQTLGVMFASPIAAGLFSAGLARGGGAWLGLPYLVTAGFIAVMAGGLWVVRVGDGSEKDVGDDE